jgi:hypothetical protein
MHLKKTIKIKKYKKKHPIKIRNDAFFPSFFHLFLQILFTGRWGVLNVRKKKNRKKKRKKQKENNKEGQRKRRKERKRK